MSTSGAYELKEMRRAARTVSAFPASREPRAEGRDFRNRYQVIARLGEGGMACVDLAILRGMAGVRKLVVLKSIRPELLADAAFRDMFLAEARLATMLSHPNIVQTFEIDERNGSPVLVMEYLEGQTSSRILRRVRGEGVGLGAKLFVLKEALAGLEYLHNCKDLEGNPQNLVHRDVSPHNVFVTYDGQVKVLDFGVAKSVGSTHQTNSQSIKGKLRYMAPEQMLGSVAIDRRADVYSVGVMLWETLAGRRLWDGLADVHVVQQVLGGEAWPGELPHHVSPSLAAICRRALAHDCNGRYESAAAMRHALDCAVDELGLQTSTQELGRAVSVLFAEQRASQRGLIEAQLRDERAGPIDLRNADDGLVSRDVYRIATAATRAMPTKARRRRSAVLRGAGAAVMVVAALSLFRWVETSRAHRQAQRAPTVASAHRADEQVLLPQPGAISSAGQVGSHVQSDRVEAAGSPGASLAGTREALPDPSRRTKPNVPEVTRDAHARTSTPNQLAKAHTLEANRACVPPFYYDEQGVKRLRPECFK